jgi:hypothetical protein
LIFVIVLGTLLDVTLINNDKHCPSLVQSSVFLIGLYLLFGPTSLPLFGTDAGKEEAPLTMPGQTFAHSSNSVPKSNSLYIFLYLLFFTLILFQVLQ